MKMVSDLLKSQYSSEGIMQGRKRSSTLPSTTLKYEYLVLFFFHHAAQSFEKLWIPAKNRLKNQHI